MSYSARDMNGCAPSMEEASKTFDAGMLRLGQDLADLGPAMKEASKTFDEKLLLEQYLVGLTPAMEQASTNLAAGLLCLEGLASLSAFGSLSSKRGDLRKIRRELKIQRQLEEYEKDANYVSVPVDYVSSGASVTPVNAFISLAPYEWSLAHKATRSIADLVGEVLRVVLCTASDRIQAALLNIREAIRLIDSLIALAIYILRKCSPTATIIGQQRPFLILHSFHPPDVRPSMQISAFGRMA